MTAPWAQAVTEAADYPLNSVQEAIIEELGHLWSDLDRAYSDASNTVWSVGCDYLVTRIVRLTRMAGIAPSGTTITFPLLLNGIWSGVLEAAGISYEPVDVDGVLRMATANGFAQCEECRLWGGHHTKPCSKRPRTQYEIDTERIAAFYGLQKPEGNAP